MPNKIKIIAIMGKSGVGKDTIAKMICKNKKYHAIVSTTTRPKRDNEVDGKDYHFISTEEFGALIEQNKMLEATFFNNWCYGTNLDSLDPKKINVGVFNPEGIRLLASSNNVELFLLYLVAGDKIRLMRQLKREKIPNINEIIRRFITDEKDFNSDESELIPSGTYWTLIKNENWLDLLSFSHIFKHLERRIQRENH